MRELFAGVYYNLDCRADAKRVHEDVCERSGPHVCLRWPRSRAMAMRRAKNDKPNCASRHVPICSVEEIGCQTAKWHDFSRIG